MANKWALFISCEHGGNKVPRELRRFVDDEMTKLLQTHRGWDPGALTIAKAVVQQEQCPFFYTEVSRLVMDCNRSIHHKNCYGPNYRDVPQEVKGKIAEAYYYPYRQSVIEGIKDLRSQGYKVLHCAFHSFTPELNGEVRNAEFGLLYDPARTSEKKWADLIMSELHKQNFPWRMRRNYPYLGKSDGFTRLLRKSFSDAVYAGFELEFNQAIFLDKARASTLRKEMLMLFSSLPVVRT